ncbi:class V aminotransferase [Plautia stali symbiont]|nr:class V aminotransferase [Plautia stali symbiont]
MTHFSPGEFRQQFPALSDAGVYLDSAATALKPQAVIDATAQFYSLSGGTVHRSQFAAARALTAQYEQARAWRTGCRRRTIGKLSGRVAPRKPLT